MYSGKQVIKAGETLLLSNLSDTDPNLFSRSMDILSFWRFSFEDALDTAFSILVRETLPHDSEAIFAKRLKRHPSIVSKLKRFDTMKLKNMQDIGGCRVILKDEKKLRKVVRSLKLLPEFQNKNGKYKYKDYIKTPKKDGYRGYHLIGRFIDSQGKEKSIEIQLRTNIQHSWATALEIVDLFTGQALKSSIGEDKWKDFFSATSEQFEVIERMPLYSGLSPQEFVSKFAKKLSSSNDIQLIYSHKLCLYYLKDLGVIERLGAFAGSLKVIDNQLLEIDSKPGYILLVIDFDENNLTSTLFSDDLDGKKDAEKSYIEAEKYAAAEDGIVVALVSSSNVGGIREAYPNYFADSTNFLKYLGLLTKIDNPIKLNMKRRMKFAGER